MYIDKQKLNDLLDTGTLEDYIYPYISDCALGSSTVILDRIIAFPSLETEGESLSIEFISNYLVSLSTISKRVCEEQDNLNIKWTLIFKNVDSSFINLFVDASNTVGWGKYNYAIHIKNSVLHTSTLRHFNLLQNHRSNIYIHSCKIVGDFNYEVSENVYANTNNPIYPKYLVEEEFAGELVFYNCCLDNNLSLLTRFSRVYIRDCTISDSNEILTIKIKNIGCDNYFKRFIVKRVQGHCDIKLFSLLESLLLIETNLQQLDFLLKVEGCFLLGVEITDTTNLFQSSFINSLEASTLSHVDLVNCKFKDDHTHTHRVVEILSHSLLVSLSIVNSDLHKLPFLHNTANLEIIDFSGNCDLDYGSLPKCYTALRGCTLYFTRNYEIDFSWTKEILFTEAQELTGNSLLFFITLSNGNKITLAIDLKEYKEHNGILKYLLLPINKWKSIYDKLLSTDLEVLESIYTITPESYLEVLMILFELGGMEHYLEQSISSNKVTLIDSDSIEDNRLYKLNVGDDNKNNRNELVETFSLTRYKEVLNDITFLTVRCPSTHNHHILTVPPDTSSVKEALEWINRESKLISES